MKRLHVLVLAAALFAMLAFPGTAFAEHLTGKDGWAVTYTAGGELTDNYSSAGFVDDIKGLQPGDDITLTITLNQQNDKDTDWYMANEVLKSLEEGDATGSAYGYELSYVNAAGESETLYQSASLGGTGSKGLKDANSGLEDYFYLDTLAKGKSGKVTLKVTLDGETEGNAYYSTLAQIRMKFAVDPSGTRGANTNKSNVVKTGDDTDLLPFYVIMVASGVLLVALGAVTVRQRRKNREEGAR